MRSILFVAAVMIGLIVYVAMTAPENLTPDAQVMTVPTPQNFDQNSADMYKTYAEGNLANAQAGATSISSKSDAALDYATVIILVTFTVMCIFMFVKVLKI